VREKLYLRQDEIPHLLAEVSKTLPESLILSTCNRTEFYGVTSSPSLDPKFYKDLLIDFKDARGLVSHKHFFTLISCGACQQLFNVATSVDSKIVGDSQILRQLRDAYRLAGENSVTGKVLNQLLQRALKIGKKTFTETAIHQGAISVSLAAVESALEMFESLRERTVFIIGGGETARLTAESLVNKRVGKILIANRTRSVAEELLAELHKTFNFDSEVVDFENFTNHLTRADIVISSTGSEQPIIYENDLAAVQRKILLIDIAVPRDIDSAVSRNPHVVLRNIDDLQSIIDENRDRRLRDLPKIKKLVMQEVVDFLSWYYSLPLMPTYEKTGRKPAPEQAEEVIKIKTFLNRNLSEIHKLAVSSGNDFQEDLANHFSLIEKLRTMRTAELAS
jgi:glutamyl-tRNA reductase